MIQYVLQIKLLSSMTSSGGVGRVGLVDRDVAFDNLGLPVLPGKRLKGLWREAYRDVMEAWSLCGASATPAERIFGEAGGQPGNGSACLYVASAELRDAPSLKPWLAYLQNMDQKAIYPIRPDDVTQFFCAIRTQTAIDRYTGAAHQDTLRFTRTLRPGLIFQALVRFDNPPNATLLHALTLGAAALQSIGIARTRGFGKVECRLLARDENGQMSDLLEQIPVSEPLPSLSRPSHSHQQSCISKRSKSTPSVFPVSRAVPTHLLRYRLALTAPAIIPVADGDPNTVMTRDIVPGSHLWGVAAWQYLRQPDNTSKDDAFRYLFLDGNLRFLSAYPEAHDPHGLDERTQRLIPVPHSIRKFKDGDDLVDLLEIGEVQEPLQRLERRYARIGETVETQTVVRTELNYHHARAGDRRVGRALGAEIKDGGSFFVYEAIQAGQSFQGAVLGSETDLRFLQTLLNDTTLIRIGRSRSAQYGEAKLEWVDDAPQALTAVSSEWCGFVDGGLALPPLLDNRLIITALSPLLAVNDRGHPEACFPKQELIQALGLESSATALTLVRSYSRTELIGGYQAHLRLPRQQWPAIATGSVFEFKFKSRECDISRENLLALEQSGLGLRKGEGYGRIAVNRHGYLDLEGEMEETSLDVTGHSTRPSIPLPQVLQDLFKDIAKRRCLAEIRQWAITIAQSLEPAPSHALLGRLRLFLDHNVLNTSLENLRTPAKEQLTRCKMVNQFAMMGFEPQPKTLWELLEQAGNDPESLTKEQIEHHIREVVSDQDELIGPMVDSLADEAGSMMCKDFLYHLLTALYRKQART